jgi:hypothetical protein
MWVRLRELPPPNRMGPRPGMAAFHREYLWQRCRRGVKVSSGLMAEIQPLGCLRGYAGLAREPNQRVRTSSIPRGRTSSA